MKFVQTQRFTTDRYDEIQALMDGEDRSAMKGNPSIMICRDRDAKDSYLVVVTFDSYEEAMKNNDVPATQEFAAKLGAILGGPPEFGNYDLIDQP